MLAIGQSQKYEKDMKEMREEMESKFNQILAKIDLKKLDYYFNYLRAVIQLHLNQCLHRHVLINKNTYFLFKVGASSRGNDILLSSVFSRNFV